MSMVTLKKLRYFESVARLRHFGKAANECAISQPALSMQIQDLESDLRVALLERRPEGIILTPEGLEVLTRARKVMLEVDGINSFAQSLSGLGGTLVLGVIPTVGPYILPQILPCLAKQYSEVKITIRETQTLRLMDELIHGKIDIIIAALPLDDNAIETMKLFDDKFLLATSKTKTTPIAKQLSRFIASEQLLLLEDGHCLRDQALNHCDVAGIQYGEVYGTSNLSTLLQLVANDLGITLVPELCLEVEANTKNISLTRFTNPQPYRTIALAWRKSSPRARHYKQIGEIIKSLNLI